MGNKKNIKLESLAARVDKLVSEYLKAYSEDGRDCHRFRNYDLPGYGFKIGDSLIIKNPVISAPLAGISDNTFRIFARYFGSALNFSEMVTGHGIFLGNKKSLDMIMITDFERPCALQVFGSDPDIMAEAACRMEAEADIIDINMGCPVPKILRARSGGYLLRDEAKIARIVKKVTSGIKKPVTVKIRAGWDKNNINAVNVAKIAEDNGAQAVIVHGRTVKQGFSGEVDYGIIRKVKGSVGIPVVASGDIDSPGRAAEVLDYTGCDGIMIGRAAKGRPWIFTDIILYRAGKAPNREAYDEKLAPKSRALNRRAHDETPALRTMAEIPDIGWRQELARLYLELLVYFKGEDCAVREFRKYLSWIFTGVKGITYVRRQLPGIKDYAGTMRIIDRIGTLDSESGPVK